MKDIPKETDIPRLLMEKDAAWKAYSDTYDARKAAEERLEAARQAYEYAVLYYKVRRRVMRELISAAGASANSNETENE